MYNWKIIFEDKVNYLISEGKHKEIAQQRPYVSRKMVDLHYLNTQIIFSITLHGGYLKVLDPLIQGFIVLWKQSNIQNSEAPSFIESDSFWMSATFDIR